MVLDKVSGVKVDNGKDSVPIWPQKAMLNTNVSPTLTVLGNIESPHSGDAATKPEHRLNTNKNDAIQNVGTSVFVTLLLPPVAIKRDACMS